MPANDNPYARVYANMQENIDRYGRSLMVVFPGKTSLGFIYTIGNSLKNLPELLLVCNVHPDQGMPLMNDCSDLMISRGREFGDGELFGFEGMPAKLKALHCPPGVGHEYTLQATGFFGHDDYRVTQIVIPDREGRYPPECAHPYSTQPILGRQS